MQLAGTGTTPCSVNAQQNISSTRLMFCDKCFCNTKKRKLYKDEICILKGATIF